MYILVGIWDNHTSREWTAKTRHQGEQDLHLEERYGQIFETSTWFSGARVLLKVTGTQLQKQSSGCNAKAPQCPQKHKDHGAV